MLKKCACGQNKFYSGQNKFFLYPPTGNYFTSDTFFFPKKNLLLHLKHNRYKIITVQEMLENVLKLGSKEWFNFCNSDSNNLSKCSL